MWVRSLGQEDPLEEGMATHSSILARRIPWTGEPGGLLSIGFQRVWTQLKWLCMHTNDTISKIQCVEWSPGQMIQFLPYIKDSKMKRRSNSHKVQETYEMYQPTRVVMIMSGYLMTLKNYSWGFPGVSVVKNLLTNAGDTGSTPGPGRSYMPQSNKACVLQLLSLCSRARKLQLLSPCASEARPAAR